MRYQALMLLFILAGLAIACAMLIGAMLSRGMSPTLSGTL